MTLSVFLQMYGPMLPELAVVTGKGNFDSPEARAMMLAIGLQESEFKYRGQVTDERPWWENLMSPAAGFWQFERIGIAGVLEHPASRQEAKLVLRALSYPEDVTVIWRALRHNDVLAYAFARLALFRVPEALPGEDDVDEGWEQYLEVWRPGKPHPEKWFDNFYRAWEIVKS